MKATFIGHQSWLISENGTNILVDPVFDDYIGVDAQHAITIYPPRKIDKRNFPRIDAIIISHEHSDHFHIPTLALFKQIPIYVGTEMPACVVELLQENDFELKVIPLTSTVRIGNLDFSLYPASADTVLWESRVTQIYIQSILSSCALFIAVDALISDQFVDDIKHNLIDVPTCIFVTNNSQVTPSGITGSLDNCRDLNTNKGAIGIAILQEILIDYTENLPDILNYVICGGGFTKKYEQYFGPYLFSNQKKLAEYTQFLCQNKNILGPFPGEIINICKDITQKETADWISLDVDAMRKLETNKTTYLNNPVKNHIRPFFEETRTNISYQTIKHTVECELQQLAKAIMYTRIGKALYYTESASNSSIKLLFKIYDDSTLSDASVYGLCTNSTAFVVCDHIEEHHIPFGIELFLYDYYQLLKGKIQIWDLAGISMQAWYQGTIMDSPIGFFYYWYGEQINTERNKIAYYTRWQNLMNKAVKNETDIPRTTELVYTD